MKIEIRSDSVVLDGYVNAVARDSRIMLDEYGEKYVEQISPKAFARTLEIPGEVVCLLNHDQSRKLASTRDGNLELYEDNIGLRANVTIRDAEVIEKAKKKLLRGWSFGFIPLAQHEEYTSNNMKRKYIDEMELFEVSIIDDQLLPCYSGTSIEQRAGKEVKREFRGEKELFVKVIDHSEIIPEDTEQEERAIDYSDFEKRLEILKGEN